LEEWGSLVRDRTSVEIPENIATALTLLSPEQRQQVFDFVTFLSERQEIAIDKNPPVPKQRRTFGQYRGRISMSADFDEPLPDSFWLGEE
jgi:mRNA-degrading endonuclease RelE of RelBE toxin-antitoxin system